MKKMRIFALLLVVCVLAFAVFAGCSKKDDAADEKTDVAEDTAEDTNDDADTEEEADDTEEATDALSGTYNFGGSTTVQPVAVAAAEAFQKLHPDVKISYDGTGSSTGVKNVLNGTYSLGGASRELKSEEADQGVKATPIALDGVAVVVNGDVDVDNLTLEQVAKIFHGEFTNWSEVGGSDAEIEVITRDEASGTRACFAELCLEEVYEEAEATFVDSAIVTESNGDMVTKVGETPGAIGYCGFGYIDKAVDAGGKAVSVDDAEATTDNVLSGSYPISRNLNIVYTGELEGVEKAFVDYLLSEEGQNIAVDEGFIALP